MKLRLLKPVIFFSIFTLSVLYSNKLKAQDYYNDDSLIRDTGNTFCKQLSKIISQADFKFDQMKDSLVDAGVQKTWTCKENCKLNGARECEILQNGVATEYAAIFLSRDTKDALAASYNNLCHQLKDCLGMHYVYKDKKATTSDMLLGLKNYECEMTPYGDATPEQADILVSIQPDSQTGNYDLVLEIKKYKGYY